MNGIKGYISIRKASYRWGVSERRVNQYCAEGRSLARLGSGVHGRSRKTRKSRLTRASRGSTVIPAGQAPDESPPHWNWKHPQKGSECDGLR